MRVFTNPIVRLEVKVWNETGIGLRTQRDRAMAAVDDGQETIFSIWQKGSLRKARFGHGNHMNEETNALRDYILSLVED